MRKKTNFNSQLVFILFFSLISISFSIKPNNALSQNTDSTASAVVDAYEQKALEEGDEGENLANPDFLENSFNYANPSYNVIFWILIVLIIVLIIDLIYYKFLKFKAINYLLILGSLCFILFIASEEAIGIGRSQGYEPDQPIKFSHKVHAKDNKIECMYCHSGVEVSKSALIPSVDVCMNCHKSVLKGTNTGEEEIAKIHDYYNKGIPIEWVQVHNLPDHVFFSHAQHYKIGKIDCQECHGDVKEMGRIQQVEDLGMGWCLECHRTRSVQFKDNKYYDQYTNFNDKLVSGEIDSVYVSDIGGEDCTVCHY